MLPRERVYAALDFRPPDIIPLQIHPSQGGLFEHGQKLLDLMRSLEHDFGPPEDFVMPEPPKPEDWDPDGSYHAFRTDDWGTTWEHRIFGVWGIPWKYPLADLSALATYRAPSPPPTQGPEFEAALAKARAHKERYFLIGVGGSLIEKMESLRPIEDVLADITLDTPEINRIADIIMENVAGWVERALALGADAVSFGDDYGTTDRLLLAPKVWRRFFKPRYRQLFEPILRAGKRIFFHSCGQIGALLEDFRDLGISAIWPQLSLFDPKELARRCRELGLAVQLHPDRGELMHRGTPEQIKTYVYRLVEDFGTAQGGSWLYIEIDPGFPFENVEALFEAARTLRGG